MYTYKTGGIILFILFEWSVTNKNSKSNTLLYKVSKLFKATWHDPR
jgi:hypothetical protein